MEARRHGEVKLYGEFLFPIQMARLGSAVGIMVCTFLLVMFSRGVVLTGSWSGMDVALVVLLGFGLAVSLAMTLTAAPIVEADDAGFRVQAWLGWSKWIGWDCVIDAHDPWMTSATAEHLVVEADGLHLLFLVRGFVYSGRFGRSFVISRPTIQHYWEFRQRFLSAAEL